MQFNKAHRKLFVTLAAVFVFIAAAGVLNMFNHWRIEFSIPADGVDTVECLSAYEPPTVSAVLKGDIFFTSGIPVRPDRIGEADTGKTGAYELMWPVNTIFASSECERTVNVVDTVPPVIVLVPEEREYIPIGAEYDDPGFTATDNVDGDLTASVRREVNGDTVTYTVSDLSGNTAEVTRTIPYMDVDPPVITLFGDKYISFIVGQGTYTEPGYSAFDNLDGDVTARVTVAGAVDPNTIGTYTLTYTVADSRNNTASVSRTVLVRSPLRHAPQSDQPSDGPLPDKVIYLTFDDGPGPYTERLLDILAAYNVKATFFTVGTKYTYLLAREAAEGHTVAIHSFSHNYNKIYASEDAFFEDIWAMNEIIKSQTGSYSNILRFPGGSSNVVSKFNPGIMTRLTREAEESGFTYFDWNVVSGDAGGTTNSDTVYRNVINGISGKNYAVVLQHDIKSFSVDAVERIIIWGLDNGYTFLPLRTDSPVVHHNVNN